MGTCSRSLLWTLGAACLMGIVVGQITTAQVSTGSPLSAGVSSDAPNATTAGVFMVSTTAVTVTAEVPSATANPMETTGVPSATTASAEVSSTTPTATVPIMPNGTTVQVSTGPASVVTELVGVSSAPPSGTVSTNMPPIVPNVRASAGVPSATPFVSTMESTNCSVVNMTTCTACSPGTFPSNETLSCFCCSEGFCADPTDCISCPVGHYQPLAGQLSCLLCPQGYYTNLMKSAACLPCQPGYYSNESGISACRACEKGTFKGSSDSKCEVCHIGEYQLQRGKESCDKCPENHYCPSPDVNPILCPPNAFCPAGSTQPQYCMETFLYKAGNSCELAPLTIVLLAISSAGGVLVVSLIILKQKQEKVRKTLKSPLLSKGARPHTTYGVTGHTEPVYAGW
ncbi:uncharacterized protein [Emydura macquarii macquarii]|uniref:uncharacterized protein isoform X2 n=1 Tax=Emydura macquarii macquarii TaxID=1129001 RepID=UPI00352A33D9